MDVGFASGAPLDVCEVWPSEEGAGDEGAEEPFNTLFSRGKHMLFAKFQ